MGDSTVVVSQIQGGDRPIDNEQAVNDAGSTVYRQRITFPPFRKLLDYDVRTDGNAVYVGTNVQGALVGDATWTVQKLFYDTSNRLVDAQIKQGVAWTARASLTWRSSAGD